MNPINRPVFLIFLLIGFFMISAARAIDIANPGFEEGWEGWTDGDPSGSGTAISGKANSGEKSVKLTEKSTYAAQVVAVQPNTNYRLNAFVLGAGNLGAKVGAEIFFEQTPKKSKKWRELTVTFNSGDFSDYMYFKAGVYNQNNTGDPEDYAQATFYELAASH